MVLSDRDIRRALKAGQITVRPLFPGAIQPASVDLRLDRTFLVFNSDQHAFIDVKQPVDELMRKVVLGPGEPFILHPGEFALGVTYEWIGVGPAMVGRLEGKSSLGRIGIIIHATAGYIDPGNTLKATLELHNVGRLPVKLYYKMPIAQISFSPLSSPAEHPYGTRRGNKYYRAASPQASRLYQFFRRRR